MPDVANGLKFISKLTAVETAYLREIEKKRREIRRVMLEIIDRDGVTRAAVAQMQREVDALKSVTASLGALAARDAR